MNWYREINRSRQQSERDKKRKILSPRQMRRESKREEIRLHGREIRIYGEFILRISDKWWWESLTDAGKIQVCDSYYHCEEMYPLVVVKQTHWVMYNPSDIFAAVGTDEEFLDWENQIKNTIGNKELIRKNKFKSLGI